MSQIVNKVKKVGILGGSFDPPTISHLQLASEALNVLNFDEIWMVPCGTREDKNLKSAPQQRLYMVQKALEDYFPQDFPIKVNDIEIKNGPMIPTYFLMKSLEQKYMD